ncbi:MAG: hypothetical protein ABIX01_02725 [Chitinophagaceae bacterium]
MPTQTETAVMVLVLLIIIQLALFIIGKKFGKLATVVSILNILVAVAIVAYWLLKYFQATMHYVELREVVVLGVEIMLLASASYSLMVQHSNQAVKVTQYVFFGIHFLCSILFLIFMLTFRITKLF